MHIGWKAVVHLYSVHHFVVSFDTTNNYLFFDNLLIYWLNPSINILRIQETMIDTDREKFYKVINQFDCLRSFWDQDNHQIRKNELIQAMGLMSSGEKRLACFMATVWFHSDRAEFPFSLVESMHILDGPHRQVIVDWINDPYWP